MADFLAEHSQSLTVANTNATHKALYQTVTDLQLHCLLKSPRGSYVLSSSASEPPRYGRAFALDDLVNFWSSAMLTLSARRAYIMTVEKQVTATTQSLPVEHSMLTFLHERSISMDSRELFLAQALAMALSPHCHEGWIYLNTLPQLLACICRLIFEAGCALSTSPPPGGRHKWLELDARTRTHLLAGRAHPSIDLQMPALLQIVHSHREEQPFADIGLIACQHIFPSNAVMFECMHLLGLRRSKALIMGKGRSTDEETYYQMLANGWYVSATSLATLNDMVTVSERMERLKVILNQSPVQRWLVIDEGALVIQLLHEYPQLRGKTTQFVCVEQTERGILEIEAMQERGIPLFCPVWNVARSLLKKHWEGPMIGQDVVQSACEELKRLMPISKMLSLRQAVILGYGAVGKSVAMALRARQFDVWLYDPCPKKMKLAQAAGLHIATTTSRSEALKELLPKAHVLFGCAGTLSGRTALCEEELFNLPDGAVLFNAASGNDQFAQPCRTLLDANVVIVGGMRQTIWQGQQVTLGRADDSRPHRVIRLRDNTIFIACDGYAINRVRDIPPPYIDLTRALMLQACLLAVMTQKAQPILQEIPWSVQEPILNAVQTHLASYGGSLTSPDFRPFDTVATRRPAGKFDTWLPHLERSFAEEATYFQHHKRAKVHP